MSDPNINPYEPPSVDSQLGPESREQTIEQIRRRVSRPGMALMILGSIASVFPAVKIISLTIFLLTHGLGLSSMISHPIIPQILVDGGFFMLWLLISIGGAKLAFMESYRLARTAAAIACVPLMTPFIVIGIPFGIWGLILLKDPKVKAAFESVARNKR